MNLIIKKNGNQTIPEKDIKWAETKFIKLTKLAPLEAVVEVTLEDLYGPKGGRDKKVHVLATLPQAKEPFHLEEIGINLRKTISIARDRFERYLKRYHERHGLAGRFPRKYWIDKVLKRFRREGGE